MTVYLSVTLLQQPSLKELKNLPLAADWLMLGLQLGVSLDKLKQFQADNAHRPNHSQLCLIAMFDWWLKMSGNPTYKQLIEALNVIDRRDVAKKLSLRERIAPKAPIKDRFRKLWGNLQSYTTDFVKNVVKRLGSLASTLTIRRRYKKYKDVKRWWFEIEGEENDLQALETSKEWSKIQATRHWRLEHCFMSSA